MQSEFIFFHFMPDLDSVYLKNIFLREKKFEEFFPGAKNEYFYTGEKLE